MALSGTAYRRIKVAVANAGTATEISDAIDANTLKTSFSSSAAVTANTAKTSFKKAAAITPLVTTTAEWSTSYIGEVIVKLYNGLKDSGAQA